MRQLIGTYLHIYKKHDQGILSTRIIIATISAALSFYYIGGNTCLDTVNMLLSAAIIMLAIIYSGDCLINPNFEQYNQTLKGKFTNLEQLIAANLCFVINVLATMLSLIVVDFYYQGFQYASQKGLKIICFLIFGLAMGNLLMVPTKKIDVNIKRIIALGFGLFFVIFFYRIIPQYLFIDVVIAYSLSIIFHKNK